MKAEHAQARADRKAKLHEKISQLNSKLQAHLQKAKEQRQAAEREAQIKADILKAKAKAVSAKRSIVVELSDPSTPLEPRGGFDGPLLSAGVAN